MAKRITLEIPDALLARAKVLIPDLNLSALTREVLERELQRNASKTGTRRTERRSKAVRRAKKNASSAR